MEYKIGDEIEIVENDGWFWDKVLIGDKGYVHHVDRAGNLGITVFYSGGLLEVTQGVNTKKLHLIRKVKKEIRKSGFAKFIQRVDTNAA